MNRRECGIIRRTMNRLPLLFQHPFLLRISVAVILLCEILLHPALGQETQNLARLPGVVALAESENRDRWGLDGWHASYAIDGSHDLSGAGPRTTCWASDNWEYTHGLVIVFPKTATVSELAIFWGGPTGSPLTPRKFVVEGFLSGNWKVLNTHESSKDEASTVVSFPPTTMTALRISQPPDGAHLESDRRLWIADVEVKGVVSANAAEAPVQGLAVQFRQELAQRRQAEADARVKPLLDVVMRTPKTRGFMGIVNRDDRARGRANTAKYAWAKQAVESTCKQAEWWLNQSDEYIYSLIPPENPRALCPSFEKGCPIHGGARGSFTATMEAPFRWKCNAGGEEWYDGAIVKNPATGAEVTVRDDGSGWLAPAGFPNAGRRYYFVAAYRYFILGKLFGTPYEGDGGSKWQGSTAVIHLAQAYAYTGDARYAHKAGVMLNRLAEVYRFMDGCVEGPSQRQDGYIGQTFERFWVQQIALACDLVWDEIQKDTALVDFFKLHGGADYDGDGAVSTKDIAYNLQHNLLGYIYEYVHRLMPYLDGDFLIYEMGGLASVASALQNGDLAKEMLEGDYGLRMLLSTEFFRDGKFIYDSTGYNVGNAQQVAVLAEWMHGFQDGVYLKQPLDLYNDPRYRMGELLNFCRFVDCDGRGPQIGDGGGSRTKILQTTAPYSMYDERALLRLTGDRSFYASRIASAANGNVDSFRDGKADYWLVFHADDTLTPKPVGNQVPTQPRVDSHLFPDSGIAILRAGTRPDTRWHLPFTFSKGSYGHGHPDKLAINVIASGFDLSADLGYPTTWTDAKYPGWETNTASHWTVMLDETASQSYVMGKLGFHDTSPNVDSVEASCESAYPGCSLYRRTVALVRDAPDGEPLYAVDLFRVAGAKVRDYLHHSMGNPDEMQLTLSAPHGEWAAQAKGTLAGENVEFAAQPGYGFLKEVKRLAYDGPFFAEWRVSGASQPDRYLWTRHDFGDCDIEFTVTRTGKASGNQERGVLVWNVDPSNPGNRRQCWIDAGGTMLPLGQPIRMKVQVRSGKAAVNLDGKPIERGMEVIGNPPARGRVGFLHYYNYSFIYDDLTITPVNGNAAPVGDDFSKPLSSAVWDRIEPTYRVNEGHLIVADTDVVALRLLVPGGIGAGAELITARGEGYGLRGRSPWEAHVILRDRKTDPASVTTFASVLEVHEGESRVQSVERLSITPSYDKAVALRVVAGGRTDYVLSSLDVEKQFTVTDGNQRVEFQGRFGWLSLANGKVTGSRLVGGGYLRCGALRLESPGDLRGTIVATDIEKSKLRIRFDGGSVPKIGQLLLVNNPGFACPSVYRISFVLKESEGTCMVSLGATPLAIGRGRVGVVDEKVGSFSCATPLLKLRFNAGLYNGRRVRPAEQNSTPEFKLTTATEAAFQLADPTGVKSFKPGSEFVVYDVGAGDEAKIVSAIGR